MKKFVLFLITGFSFPGFAYCKYSNSDHEIAHKLEGTDRTNGYVITLQIKNNSGKPIDFFMNGFLNLVAPNGATNSFK